jgi:DNA-binding XRE family transcriptional regulator
VQGQDVISCQFFQPDLKLDWVMHSYIELGAVTKVDNHSGYLVIGYFDFLDNFTSDRAIGPPATNRFRFFHARFSDSGYNQYGFRQSTTTLLVMQDIQKRVGANVRAWRLKRKMTQAVFADRAGLNRAHVGEIERGESNVTIQTLKLIADTLKVKVVELVRGV